MMHCLRRFRTLRKNTPWIFGACTLGVLLIFIVFSNMLMSSCRFPGLPAGCVCVGLPAALQNPQNFGACTLWVLLIVGEFWYLLAICMCIYIIYMCIYVYILRLRAPGAPPRVVQGVFALRCLIQTHPPRSCKKPFTNLLRNNV